MKLVTLEDKMTPNNLGFTGGDQRWGESDRDYVIRKAKEKQQSEADRKSVTLLKSSSTSQTNPKQIGDTVPHFSWMLNDDVLLDALGSQRTKSPGSAFGLIMSETVNTSGFGVFRTKYDQPIVILTEVYAGDNENKMCTAMQTLGCFGNDPIYIDVARGEGDGYIEQILMPRIREQALPRLIELENKGPSKKVIVIRVKGRPITWSYAAELALEYAEVAVNLAMEFAAPYAKSLLGIDASDFMKAAPLVKQLARNEPVDVSSLAAAAVMAIPQSIRPTLNKAADFYQKVQNGQYLPAAQALGIDVSKINNVLNEFASDVPPSVAKTAQGIYVMDTINQVRGTVRSGTAKQEIINSGTITQSTAIQNMLMTAMSLPTAAMPRAIEISGLAATETNDLQNTNEWRGIWQIAHGVPVTKCALDRLALRGLIERARDLAQKGFNQINIPSLIPDDKRNCFADEVRAQTGLKTSASAPGISPTFLLGVAGVAGVAYFAMRK